MSTLRVDNITNEDGSASPNLPNGLSGDVLTSGTVDTARMPAGSVIQVVQGTSTIKNLSTTSTSFVNTGLNLSITPISTTSKIYFILSTTLNAQTVGNFVDLSIFRSIDGGSETNLADSSPRDSFPGAAHFSVNADIHYPATINHLDSPNTALTINYIVKFKSRDGGSVRFNPEGFLTTFILMEIAG